VLSRQGHCHYSGSDHLHLIPLSEKKIKSKRAKDMVQVVKHLLNNCEVLSWSFHIASKKSNSWPRV
jgi:hypothetical protein